jgi:IS30 family transposase
VIDVNKLRGAIAENRLTNRELAKRLNMTDNTFYRKMKRGVFDSDEMEAMIGILHIQDPMAIFFAKRGA